MNRDRTNARIERAIAAPMIRPPPSPPTRTSRAVRGEAAPQCREGPVAARVQDQVVPLPAVGDLFGGVVDHTVGTDRADQIHLRGAAHPGHLGAQSLGDLHGEQAHPARGTDDQDPLPRRDLAGVPQRLQSGTARRGDGGRLLERQARRLDGQRLDPGGGVVGERAVAHPEDIVPGVEAGHVRAHGLDGSGDIHPPDPRLRARENRSP